MLDAAEEAVAYANERSRADLRPRDIATHGLVRLVEIVGEAATRVSAATRAELPDVAWHEIVGMRNRVVHGYNDVNLTVVWSTVTRDMPPLIAALRRHLAPVA